jgi:L-aspartate oxidase
MMIEDLISGSEYPLVVIGAGLAGFSAALTYVEADLTGTRRALVICTEDAPGSESNSTKAAGGIIYEGEGDPNMLQEDVWVAGRSAGFRPAIEQLAILGPRVVRELLIDGAKVPFDRAGTGFSTDGLALTREGSHSNNRIIHVGDSTGKVIMKRLGKAVVDHPRIDIATGHMMMEILTSSHHTKGFEHKYGENRCLGVYVYDVRIGTVKTILAENTILATGGVGQVYKNTVNNVGAIGSGIAAASRAGVRNINMRFVQFHPTAFRPPNMESGEIMPLVTEAVRGEGGRLVTKRGDFLMEGFPHKDLEGRDVVSQEIFRHLKKTGDDCVYLDIASYYIGDVPLAKRFPAIYKACLEHGIDFTKEPIPVAPAAHFACGGIAVDLDGKTELKGLYAVGEVSCTGVHGANRLASTSLLECVVWGRQAALSVLASAGTAAKGMFKSVKDWMYFKKDSLVDGDLLAIKMRLREVMWDKVGIMRSQEELQLARSELARLRVEVDRLYVQKPLSKEIIELRHLIGTAHAIAWDASEYMNLQEDSIGGHLLVQDGPRVVSEEFVQVEGMGEDKDVDDNPSNRDYSCR